MQQPAWQWRPQSVADLLDNTFRVFRAQFGLFFGLSAIVLVPLALLQVLLIPELPFTSPFDLLNGAPPDQMELFMLDLFASYNWAAYTGGVFLTSIVTLVGQSLLFAAITWTVKEHVHGRANTIGTALGQGARFMLRLVGNRPLLALLSAVAMVGLMMVAVFIGLFFDAPFFAVFLALLGIALFGILVGVRWVLAAPAIVVEDAGAFGGIGRSFALSRGAIGAILGRFLLFTLMLMILGGLTTAVVGAATGAALFWGSVRLIAVISGFGGALVAALFQPLMPIMLTLLYFDRRVRKEGYDLERLTEQLDSDS